MKTLILISQIEFIFANIIFKLFFDHELTN